MDNKAYIRRLKESGMLRGWSITKLATIRATFEADCIWRDTNAAIPIAMAKDNEVQRLADIVQFQKAVVAFEEAVERYAGVKLPGVALERKSVFPIGSDKDSAKEFTDVTLKD